MGQPSPPGSTQAAGATWTDSGQSNEDRGLKHRPRREVLSDWEYESPLAKWPYDLRHAAVSHWLNAGVPPTQVAEWAGHSVNVLLRVNASCVVGQDEGARLRVQAALGKPAGVVDPDDPVER